MARAFAITVLVFIVCAHVWADEVGIGSVTYSDSKILRAEKGSLVFRTSGGNEVAKPIADVVSVYMESLPQLNQAERLAAEGKYGQAVRVYEQVLAGSTGQVLDVIRYRLLAAIRHAGPVDKAIALWLNLAAQPGAAKGLRPLRPDNFGVPGSQANSSAIVLLESARSRAAMSKEYLSAVNEVLFALYEHEGRTRDSAALARDISGLSSPSEATGTRPAAEGSDSALIALGALVELGQAKAVLIELQQKLKRGDYDAGQLPWVLTLLGKARQKIAGKMSGDKKREFLISAGLDLMRVVVCYPSSSKAPEALFAAGQINAALGNREAARKAWQLVATAYPDSNWAHDAIAEIKTLPGETVKDGQ